MQESDFFPRQKKHRGEERRTSLSLSPVLEIFPLSPFHHNSQVGEREKKRRRK